LHLDNHFFPAYQAGGVHLGNRSRGYRGSLEVGEHVFEPLAELSLDDLAHSVKGLGRHSVAAQPELRHELGREDAFSRGEDLAQLDVRRAQVLESLA
jgi:hypothetical protein